MKWDENGIAVCEFCLPFMYFCYLSRFILKGLSTVRLSPKTLYKAAQTRQTGVSQLLHLDPPDVIL